MIAWVNIIGTAHDLHFHSWQFFLVVVENWSIISVVLIPDRLGITMLKSSTLLKWSLVLLLTCTSKTRTGANEWFWNYLFWFTVNAEKINKLEMITITVNQKCCFLFYMNWEQYDQNLDLNHIGGHYYCKLLY